MSSVVGIVQLPVDYAAAYLIKNDIQYLDNKVMKIGLATRLIIDIAKQEKIDYNILPVRLQKPLVVICKDPCDTYSVAVMDSDGLSKLKLRVANAFSTVESACAEAKKYAVKKALTCAHHLVVHVDNEFNIRS